MRALFGFFILVLIVAVCAFAMLNAQPVTVQFLVGKSQIPLVVSLLVALGVGVGLTFLLLLGPLVKLRLKCSLLESRINKAKQKLLSIQHSDVKDNQ